MASISVMKAVVRGTVLKVWERRVMNFSTVVGEGEVVVVMVGVEVEVEGLLERVVTMVGGVVGLG